MITNQPISSNEIVKILNFCDIIKNCKDVKSLNELYQKENYNHPQIYYDFGVLFLIFEDYVSAKKAFIKGGIYGIQYPCAFYDHLFIDSVGQCLTNLMTRFSAIEADMSLKISSLAYIYLSRCIELYPRQAQDSYRTRALLFKDHENFQTVNSLRYVNSFMINTNLLVISDFYFASKAKNSQHKDCLLDAKKIHKFLWDRIIEGKSVCDYSLLEISELGEKRHLILFKYLENEYKSGKLNISLVDFLFCID